MQCCSAPSLSSDGSSHLSELHLNNPASLVGGGGGVLLYIGYIGMCGSKGYSFSAVLIINRVSILAYLGYFGHK